MSKSFVEYLANDIVEKMHQLIEYRFACKPIKVFNSDESKAIVLSVLFVTRINNVEVMQCAPFSLVVIKYHSEDRPGYWFGVTKLTNDPEVISTDVFDEKKIELQSIISKIKDHDWKIPTKTPDEVNKISISKIDFYFHHRLRECIVAINGARIISVKYSPDLERFVLQFLSGLYETIEFGIKSLKFKNN